jgi:hypothetical protein
MQIFRVDCLDSRCILRRLLNGAASAAATSQTEARWQSGYAADCNSVYAGSIPTLASIFTSGPGGGIGRRNGLKIRYSKECAGSSPAPGTNNPNVY